MHVFYPDSKYFFLKIHLSRKACRIWTIDAGELDKRRRISLSSVQPRLLMCLYGHATKTTREFSDCNMKIIQSDESCFILGMSVHNKYTNIINVTPHCIITASSPARRHDNEFLQATNVGESKIIKLG